MKRRTSPSQQQQSTSMNGAGEEAKGTSTNGAIDSAKPARRSKSGSPEHSADATTTTSTATSAKPPSTTQLSGSLTSAVAEPSPSAFKRVVKNFSTPSAAAKRTLDYGGGGPDEVNTSKRQTRSDIAKALAINGGGGGDATMTNTEKEEEEVGARKKQKESSSSAKRTSPVKFKEEIDEEEEDKAQDEQIRGILAFLQSRAAARNSASATTTTNNNVANGGVPLSNDVMSALHWTGKVMRDWRGASRAWTALESLEREVRALNREALLDANCYLEELDLLNFYRPEDQHGIRIVVNAAPIPSQTPPSPSLTSSSSSVTSSSSVAATPPHPECRFFNLKVKGHDTVVATSESGVPLEILHFGIQDAREEAS